MTQHLLFPTVIHTHYIEPDKDTRILKDIISRTNKKPHGLLNSGLSTYGFSQTILNNPLLNNLKGLFTEIVNEWADALNIDSLEITNSWANVLGQDSRIDWHRHTRSVVSGAYYLNVPKGSLDLEFRSPLEPLRQCETFKNRYLATESNYLNEDTHKIPCEENLLIIFPSWLEHGSCLTNQSIDRITVSFNTYYRDK